MTSKFVSDIDSICTLEIQPGSPAQESRDWAAMLAGMYKSWAMKRGFVLDERTKEITFADAYDPVDVHVLEISGDRVWPLLRGENGAHMITKRNEEGLRCHIFSVVHAKNDLRGGLRFVRTYVTDGYNMVRDFATGKEIDDVNGVLEGNLDLVLGAE